VSLAEACVSVVGVEEEEGEGVETETFLLRRGRRRERRVQSKVIEEAMA
jgi:hypothetical protein